MPSGNKDNVSLARLASLQEGARKAKLARSAAARARRADVSASTRAPNDASYLLASGASVPGDLPNASALQAGTNITITGGTTINAPTPAGVVLITRRVDTTAPLTGGGDLSADRTLAISDFVGSGASHARGAVPDPGVTGGTSKYLREDASWTQPDHTAIANIGTNSHAAIDTFIASKAAASGLASLDGSSLVVQNPANATATPSASKIPIASASALLDAWISSAGASTLGLIQLAGALSGTAASPGVLGRLLASNVLVTGSGATYTPNARATAAIVMLIGPGGGGAGCAGGTSKAACGAGGGAGGFTMKYFSGLTAGGWTGTYTLPVGGLGGTAAANGNAALASATFQIGATTLTCTSGQGGAQSAAGTVGVINSGGTGGSGSNGDLNCNGQPGCDGIVLSATVSKSGFGAPAPLFGGGAPGRAANGAGTSATTPGAGGSGANEINTTNTANGGNGGTALAWVLEFE